MRYLLPILLFCVPLVMHADEPPPVPIGPLKAALSVSKGVPGDGTHKSPFVFRQGVKGRIEMKSDAAGNVVWNLDDCPAGDDPTEITTGGRGILFATVEPGVYHAMAACQDGTSILIIHAWFEIKGSGPAPPPEADLSKRLRAALTGPDAKADALKLAKICQGVADSFSAATPGTAGEVVAAWKAAYQAVSWPGGKYPDIPEVIRVAIPPVDEKTKLTADQLAAIISNLRTLAATADLIAGGK